MKQSEAIWEDPDLIPNDDQTDQIYDDYGDFEVNSVRDSKNTKITKSNARSSKWIKPGTAAQAY